jgi:hypothetical protein
MAMIAQLFDDEWMKMFRNGKAFLEFCELVYKDLTPESTIKILEASKRGEKLKPVPQSGHLNCEPAGDLTTFATLP